MKSRARLALRLKTRWRDGTTHVSSDAANDESVKDGWNRVGTGVFLPADEPVTFNLAALGRKGLKLDTGKNQGSLVIRMRSSSDTQVNVWANGKNVGKTTIAAGKDYSDYRLPLKETTWTGTINNLKIAAYQT